MILKSAREDADRRGMSLDMSYLVLVQTISIAAQTAVLAHASRRSASEGARA